MIIGAYAVLFFVAVLTLYESRRDSAIWTPRAEGILLAFALLGGVLSGAFLAFAETRGPIEVALAWVLVLFSIPLVLARVRILHLAMQLERHGETTEPRDISTFRSGHSQYWAYRYGDSCRGRAPVITMRGAFKVLYLPGRPQVHRLIPAKPASRRAPERYQVTTSERITASHGALAAVIQKLLDAPQQHFVIFSDEATGRLVQFLGPPEEGPGLVLDVPVLALGEDEASRVRSCLERRGLQVQFTDLSLYAVLAEDAQLAAAIGMDILGEAYGLPGGAELAFEFRRA